MRFRSIPESTETNVILRPIGRSWVNGLSELYEEKYPQSLATYMGAETFYDCIHEINDALVMNWPCGLCECFGYSCSLCTLGLSLLLPHLAVSKARTAAEREIKRINRRYNDKGIHWALRVKCCTSWIEIRINKEVFLEF